MGRDTKRKLYLRKRHFFVIEKYAEDAKQKEKDVPDLVESIMKAPGLVKEKLRRILFKRNQFRPEILKIRVCTFQMSGKIPDSTNVAFEALISTPFLQYLAPLGAKYMKKMLKKCSC